MIRNYFQEKSTGGGGREKKNKFFVMKIGSA